MKPFFLTAIIVFSYLTAYSQNYRLNDTLYVWEMHGVEMIANPENPDVVQEKFYYGLPARVVDIDIHRHAVSMEVNKGFEMQGHWVRVIINQDTGYVFDGFLSHFHPFDLRSNTRGIGLLRNNFQGFAEVSKDVRSFSAEGLSNGESRDLSFQNGIEWNIKNVEPCIVEKYTVPTTRFAEAYQLMMAVYSNYFDQDANYMAEPEFVRVNGAKYDFILKDNDGSRQISVYYKNGKYEINSFSCQNKSVDN